MSRVTPVVSGPAARAGDLVTGLVADDLTGATDAAVQFAEAGWDARLVRRAEAVDRPGPDSGRPRLEAVTTGTRASSDQEAAAATSAAVTALLGTGIERLFVKIDSTVRGSVAGQVRGALAAWRAAHPDAVAVICPAFPAHGRTVVAGSVLVHGEPVTSSAAGRDPVTPVTTSSLAALFPGSRPVPAGRLLEHRARSSYVVDACDDDDLARIAAAVEQLGPRAVAVGSGGLAAAVAARSSAPRPVARGGAGQPAHLVLVAVSSLHPVTQRQLVRLLRSCDGAAPLPEHSGSEPVVTVVSTPTTLSPAARSSPTVSPSRQSLDVAAAFAHRVCDELGRRPYDALVLIGGDGALAVLDRLGVAQIEIVADLAPGTPHGRVLGGAAHGLRVVTRSGGFGEPDSLVEIVRRLQGQPPDRPPSVRLSPTTHRDPEELT